MRVRKKLFFELFIFSVLLIIALFKWIDDFETHLEIQLNKGETTGKIIDYQIVGPDKHYLTHEYYITGALYQNKIIPNKLFKNCVKTNVCLGRKFVVYYSKKNPEKSKIDLDQEIYKD